MDNIPIDWLCPISQELMRHPVIAQDGFSYEEDQIKQWFTRSSVSPMTGAQVENKTLIPNHALRHTIQEFIAKQEEKVSPDNDSGVVKSPPILKNKKVVTKLEDIKYQLGVKIYDETPNSRIVSVKVNTTLKTGRMPIAVYCIIDVSESMNLDAVAEKSTESHGFSRLDLVKHSVLTMSELLSQIDYLGLVVFATGAQQALPLIPMTRTNKVRVRKALEALQGEGTTNIWDGFRVTLEVLASQSKFYGKKTEEKNTFVVLLTDGMPNLNPPRGIMTTLQRYLASLNISTPNFHIFGYGNQLDIKLLSELASFGYGTYAYIPDCSMVGTVFINFLANCIATATNKATLSLSLDEAYSVEALGWDFNTPSAKEISLNIGSVIFSQERRVFFRIVLSPDQVAQQPKKVSFGTISLLTPSGLFSAPIATDKAKMGIETMKRYEYLQLLRTLIQSGSDLNSAALKIKSFYQSVPSDSDSEFLKALRLQLINNDDENTGQVMKAVSKADWYSTWGKNYLPALMFAHRMQVCTNFKDPAVQTYRGELFDRLESNLDLVFIRLPPPKPSAKKKDKVVYVAPPVNMRSYYNCGGGCVDGEATVTVTNKGIVKVKNLKKGDHILPSFGQGRGAKIVCLVQTLVFGQMKMIKLGKLLITPWHPVKRNDQWVFPASLGKEELVYVESVFNFILTKQSASIEVEGEQCLALANGVTDGAAKHAYLSTQSVLRDIALGKGFQEGRVRTKMFCRDKVTQEIVMIQCE